MTFMEVCGLDFCPCPKGKECAHFENCDACLARHKVHPEGKLAWCLREENQEKIKLMKEQGRP